MNPRSLKQGFVTADDGARLFFQQVGDGPSLVVIPNALYMFDEFSRLAAAHRTLVFIDWRNRGHSEALTEPALFERGIHHDVDDLDAVRRHFGASQISVIAHSYSGTTAAVYAMKYPAQAARIVQMGPMQPFVGTEYPDRLKCADAALTEFHADMQRLMTTWNPAEPGDFGSKFWALLRRLYVTNPADADRLKWDSSGVPNEFGFMKHWVATILPSIQALTHTADDWASVHVPALVIHGRKDRSAPYGGGMEWAHALGNARLLTIDDGAHVPWIEAPDAVFGAIDTFLNGEWPATARKVLSMDVA